MSQYYEMYFTPQQNVGPLGSTPAFRGLTGHGVATAYGDAYSYAQNAAAVAQVRRGSAADTTFSSPTALDCDEKCYYLPAAEAVACSLACGVLRY